MDSLTDTEKELIKFLREKTNLSECLDLVLDYARFFCDRGIGSETKEALSNTLELCKIIHEIEFQSKLS